MSDSEIDDDRSEIIAEFLSESEQYLQELNDNLLKAEEILKNDEEVSVDMINTMFRAAHTIKGTASFLDFSNISGLTHEMETILDRVRNSELVLTIDIIDVLFNAFDTLSSLLDRLKSDGTDEGDTTDVVTEIKAVLDGTSGKTDSAKTTSEEAGVSQEKITPPVEAATEVAAPSEDFLKYVGAYLDDTFQNIDRFNEVMIQLEENKVDPIEAVNELFRISHTIKGSSGIIKRNDIELVAHKMEDLLSKYREEKLVPESDIVSTLFIGIDWIKNSAAQIRETNYALLNNTDVIQKLQKCIDKLKLEKSTKSLNETTGDSVDVSQLFSDLPENLTALKENATKDGLNVFRVSYAVDANCVTKNIKANVCNEKLAMLGEIIHCKPDVELIDDNVETAVYVGVILTTSKLLKDIDIAISIDQIEVINIEKEEVSLVQEVAPTTKTANPTKTVKKEVAMKEKETPSTTKTAGVEVTTMRIDTRRLDSLMNLAGELVITRAKFAQLVSEVKHEVSQSKENVTRLSQVGGKIAELKMALRKNSSQSLGDENANANRLNKIFGLLESEMFNLSNKLSMKEVNTKLYSLDEATSALSKLSSDIQSGVMSTRMVPIEGVFTRFKRLVRDIAKELKKDINLEIYGEETELDKKIVDELGDPLTHMIRNSVDHGIETTEDRALTDKPAAGTVKLSASYEGNNICIQINDDGKGLDSNKLSEKALEKGILTQEKLDQMTEKEKFQIIFMPGFSTAAQITGISGRGVGMDVVRRTIEELNGTVEIDTELGRGTNFSIKIPLTLAIIQALLVVINNQVFAMPLECVSEIIKVEDDSIFSVEGNTTVKLRGHALSLVDLETILRMNTKSNENKNSRKIVVLTDGDETIGVEVDRLIGEDEIVIKSLPDHFSDVQGISGASILGDGSIALILDATSIIREAQQKVNVR